MSNHPYQVAISKANNLIPNWQTIVDQISEMLPKAENESDEIKTDPLLKEAALFVTESSTASTSSLQRKYSIGYNRAGAIMSKLEELKIVGPQNGSKPRKVLADYCTAKNIIESIS
jgi:S-DNA-T family DNA segregation ATPase FtsK/SpoIIIE